jgi:hypothetical protein
MILEFLSSGRLVPLPEPMDLSGLPPEAHRALVVLLPYGRALVGDVCSGYERWLFGKLDRFPWREIVLYDDSPISLPTEGLGAIALHPAVATRLRRLLLGDVDPPGSHRQTLKVLLPLLAGEGRHLPAASGSPFEELLATDSVLQRGYWGIRFALYQKDEALLERISLWLRRSRRTFDDVQGLPLFWASPSDVPSRKALETLTSLGFSEDQIIDFRSPDNPSIHRSQWGILLKQRLSEGSEGEELDKRLWLFFSVPLWENLRRRDSLTIPEAFKAAQGFLEAREGELFFRPYRPPWHDWIPAAALGPDRYESV